MHHKSVPGPSAIGTRGSAFVFVCLDELKIGLVLDPDWRSLSLFSLSLAFYGATSLLLFISLIITRPLRLRGGRISELD